MNLPEQMERVYMDGLGRVVPGGIKRKSVVKQSKSDIIDSGAVKGALTSKNDPDFKKRDAHAELFYKEMRNRNKDYVVKTLHKNTGISEKSLGKVYDHVFINKYNLINGYSNFIPDYDMAQSFQRLLDGKNIKPHDIILLKHERLEYELMSKVSLSYEEAHVLTEKKYNYTKALRKYLEDNNLR